MIIDAHNHPDWHGHNLDKFIANMDACGIDKTFLLSWECPMAEFDPLTRYAFPADDAVGPIPFARVISYIERCPDRFIPGYAPDPRIPGAIDRLKCAMAVYGVRVCGEIKLRMMYDNPDAVALFRFCGEQGLPVTIHMDYSFHSGKSYPRDDWWYGGDIHTVERLLKACPDTIILGHAPGFWAHISGDELYDRQPYPKGPVLPGGELIRLMDTCENLYCDLSAGSALNALSRDAGHAKKFITAYQDRVLYARDMFSNDHQQFLNGLGLDQAVMDKIYYKNARKLVRL